MPVVSSPRPAFLGRGEAALREEFSDALRSESIAPQKASVLVPEKLKSPAETAKAAPGETPARPAPAVKDPFAEQERLVRDAKHPDVQRVEYELFRDSVYRIRWQLAEHFGRPIMDSLVTGLTAKLGKPYYDQTILGKFGTGRATLRRSAWRDGTQLLEVRQLNPMVGGPLFVTVSDQGTIKQIIASGGTAAPEPNSIGPWWQTPVNPLPPLTVRERRALLAAFNDVMTRVHWAPLDSQAVPTSH
jgi:hypothetical protein